MLFDFSDRLHPGEGRSWDVSADTDISTFNVTAELIRVSDGAIITRPVVTDVDPYTKRVHVTDSATAPEAGRRLVLKVIISDPAARNEPEILEALLTVSTI